MTLANFMSFGRMSTLLVSSICFVIGVIEYKQGAFAAKQSVST